MKLAAHGLCLILLAFPFAVRASENLVAKREACRIEARTRILPLRKIEVDEYRRIVERRAAYVNHCITRSVVAHNDQPLPPKRVLDDATDIGEKPAVAPARKNPRRLAGRPERRKPKTASIRTVKTVKLKGKKVRLSSRRGR